MLATLPSIHMFLARNRITKRHQCVDETSNSVTDVGRRDLRNNKLKLPNCVY